MSVAVSGKPEDVPGLVTHSFLDADEGRHPHLTPEDFALRPKGTLIRGVTLHTTQGLWPQVVVPGKGRSGGALANLSAWSHDHRCAGSHLLIDPDGEVYCAADLADEQTWHATSVNRVTIGIEIVQRSDGALFGDQIAAAVVLVDWLTRRFRIQRQIPDAFRGVVPRLAEGGSEFVGIFGHRDQTTNRGRGDPGDAVFDALSAAGYERWNLLSRDDMQAWRERQTTLGVHVDGVPLAETCDAIEATGKPHGLWTPRPGD